MGSSCRMNRVTSRRSSRSSAGRRRVGKRAWRVRRVGFAAAEMVGLSVLAVRSDERQGLFVRIEKRDARKTSGGGIDVGCERDIWGRKGAKKILWGRWGFCFAVLPCRFPPI